MLQSYEAQGHFARFAQGAEPGRILSIDSGHPSVLAQPWELLRHPEGTWLFLANPRIGVCRRLSGQGAVQPFRFEPKDRLRLLFVVSRPEGSGFIDPRLDPKAVMAALDTQAPGRVEVEFLRPPTLKRLIDRLEDEDLPPIDILHFDGHGTYDPDGHLGSGPEDANQGYLLFEDEGGSKDLVSSTRLGELLNQQRVPLAVLSACESARVGGDDPLGSVAARLTRAGIPNVLAMTHSVLVETAWRLFAQLYGELGRGRTLGTALENARRELYRDQERGQRRQEGDWVTLRLQDWFLPALYRTGDDGPLLTKSPTPTGQPPDEAPRHNLPEVQPSGFWGRARELWEIEGHVVRGARRLVVHGFGGQGKTYLAQEAGRWLLDTGLFDRVCLATFAGFQGLDPVGLTLSALSQVLDLSLLDADAATEALAGTRTLLILDNLESLIQTDDSGNEDRTRLDALLDAARHWSEAGASRVLCTTRTPDLAHAAFPTDGDARCRYLKLRGLHPQDAWDWYLSLLRQAAAPPRWPVGRDELLALFQRVANHPLSIGLLVETLKDRPIAQVRTRLEALLADGGGPLVASLDLSLERLDPESLALLPRLRRLPGR